MIYHKTKGNKNEAHVYAFTGFSKRDIEELSFWL